MTEKTANSRNLGKPGKFRGKRRKFDQVKKFGVKKRRLDVEQEEIASLNQRTQSFTVSTEVKTFSDFPLSQKTLKGLEKCKYTTPTKIQLASIGLALKTDKTGKFMNVVASAKTGSGKTLAFVVPVLDRLFRLGWDKALGGLGALVLSPTRELAMQTYEVFKSLAVFHPELSIFPVFGAKDKKGKKNDGTPRYKWQREKEGSCIDRQNIVIATPGRLRELMETAYSFPLDNIQILVLDEADRLLDSGFQTDMDIILESLLPFEPQVLLFSATQTKSIKDLRRCGLTNANYITVETNSQLQKTPSTLTELYIVCELHEKLNLLWSLVKNHLKEKVIVFMATCKQVRFVYEVFCKLKPGVVVYMINGAMKQSKRMEMSDLFSRKQNALLIATDVASRGLDFPAVDTVVQLDCPADADDYVHRVGRTARFTAKGTAKGTSVLVLLPSEESCWIEKLKKTSPKIEKIHVNPKKMIDIQTRINSLSYLHSHLNDYATKAHLYYLKSVFLRDKNKEIFKTILADKEKFAKSYGLSCAPKSGFIKRIERVEAKHQEKENVTKENNKPKEVLPSSEESSISEDSDDTESNSEESSMDCSQISLEKKKITKCVPSLSNLQDDSDSDEEFITTKPLERPVDSQNIHESEINGVNDTLKEPGFVSQKIKVLTKAAVAKKALSKLKNIVRVSKKFNDDGEMIKNERQHTQLVDNTSDYNLEGLDLDKSKKDMLIEDQYDKKRYQQQIKEKHREKRLKQKELRRNKAKEQVEQKMDEYECKLPSQSDDEDSEQNLDSNDDSDQDDEPKLHISPSKKIKKTKGKKKIVSKIDIDTDSDSSELNAENNFSSKVKLAKKNKTKKKGSIQVATDSSHSYDDEISETNIDHKEKKKNKVQKKKAQMSHMPANQYEEGLFDTGHSLADDEAIALKLLSNC